MTKKTAKEELKDILLSEDATIYKPEKVAQAILDKGFVRLADVGIDEEKLLIMFDSFSRHKTDGLTNVHLAKAVKAQRPIKVKGENK